MNDESEYYNKAIKRRTKDRMEFLEQKYHELMSLTIKFRPEPTKIKELLYEVLNYEERK